MLESVFQSVADFFVKIYRFFVYKETTLDRSGVYIIMFLVIGFLLIFALNKKKSKGEMHSPFLFLVATALLIFTITY
ncbi:MAG: hypothetical protein E7361_03380 [Clostridiales bacterium]|nr:hypothetical protein [Clostridiales bacterium]